MGSHRQCGPHSLAPGAHRLASLHTSYISQQRPRWLWLPPQAIQGALLQIPLAVVACRVVPAVQALPGVGAAVVSVAIAVAGLAAGEAPEAGQAAVALSPVHAGEAVALACLRVAEGVVRTSDVALASCKERRKGAVFQCPAPLAAQHRGRGLTYACSRWAQTRRCRGHICRTAFPPRWADTGTVLRWGRTPSSASPGGHTGRLGREKH